MNFKLDRKANVNGTSFHDVEIRKNFDDLVALLGKPHYCNDPDDKVRYEWLFISDDGRGVTLYDWKSYSDKPNVWHIGGMTQEITVSFKEWFESGFWDTEQKSD